MAGRLFRAGTLRSTGGLLTPSSVTPNLLLAGSAVQDVELTLGEASVQVGYLQYKQDP